jgi:nucleoside-diphosphate-sugar epimerase
VLTTGDVGFAGSPRCRALVECGFEMAVLDVSLGNKENLTPFIEEGCAAARHARTRPPDAAGRSRGNAGTRALRDRLVESLPDVVLGNNEIADRQGVEP